MLRARRIDTLTRISAAVEQGLDINLRRSTEAALEDWVKIVTAEGLLIRPCEQGEAVFETLWRTVVANMNG